MDYPKMIYLGGDLAAEWRIVDDEAEEAAAEASGFIAHDKPKTAPKADAPKKPGPKPKAAP